MKNKDGSFKGSFRTLSVQAAIEILPVLKKSSEKAPDYRVRLNGVEAGGGWKKTGKVSGEEYVSCSVAMPELGKSPIYFNLGVMTGQDDENVFALIWNA
jgi:uncharacterized protein (DUF736 family)